MILGLLFYEKGTKTLTRSHLGTLLGPKNKKLFSRSEFTPSSACHIGNATSKSNQKSTQSIIPYTAGIWIFRF